MWREIENETPPDDREADASNALRNQFLAQADASDKKDSPQPAPEKKDAPQPAPMDARQKRIDDAINKYIGDRVEKLADLKPEQKKQLKDLELGIVKGRLPDIEKAWQSVPADSRDKIIAALSKDMREFGLTVKKDGTLLVLRKGDEDKGGQLAKISSDAKVKTVTGYELVLPETPKQFIEGDQPGPFVTSMTDDARDEVIKKAVPYNSGATPAPKPGDKPADEVPPPKRRIKR